MFMKNMSFCLQRNYENRRHGRMMYETFLANLLGSAEIPEDRITEQVNVHIVSCTCEKSDACVAW